MLSSSPGRCFNFAVNSHRFDPRAINCNAAVVPAVSVCGAESICGRGGRLSRILWCLQQWLRLRQRPRQRELGRHKFGLTATQVSPLSRHLPLTGINIPAGLITKDIRVHSSRGPETANSGIWTRDACKLSA